MRVRGVMKTRIATHSVYTTTTTIRKKSVRLYFNYYYFYQIVYTKILINFFYFSTRNILDPFCFVSYLLTLSLTVI